MYPSTALQQELNIHRHQFNSLFSRTTRVSWHEKGSTKVDFNEARDDVVAVVSAKPYSNHLHLAPDR